MPDAQEAQNRQTLDAETQASAPENRGSSTTSLRNLWATVARRRRLVFSIVGGMLLACLVYCLFAPDKYEAQARVELRTAPASALSLSAGEPLVSASILSAPVQLETVAGVLRSERLAWRVITTLKLYRAPGFQRGFAQRFPHFDVDTPSIGARAWLLRRFQSDLNVEAEPHTLLIRIGFRSRNAILSAAVVNTLIRSYMQQDRRSQVQATAQASGWLEGQLKLLKARVNSDDRRLANYESAHGILSGPETLADGQQGEADHDSTLVEVDELTRQLVAATSERILREAEYRAASKGDPELVLANDPALETGNNGVVTALLEQIRSRRSALQQQEAQLTTEDGPNFPQVVAIRRQVQDLNQQEKAQDAKLVARFRSAWQTALAREQMVRKSLTKLTGDGSALNTATARYTAMRQEADASHEVYVRVLEKVEEAGLAAGVHASDLSIVDPALPPARPVSPNLPLYMAITLFISLWLALGAALLAESLNPKATRAGVALLAVLAACTLAHAQAPTPSTSGLPTGVASFPPTPVRKSVPNPRQAPAVWNAPAQANPTGAPGARTQLAEPIPAAIAPGDMLDVSEYHTPEFHSQVRVATDGTVTLPLIGDIHVAGLSEKSAAQAIEKSLVAKGMLLHPLVSVVVTVYAGQDVSVLGEVKRPGIYPYTMHHRLLDLISAASGLAPDAGSLVDIIHRNDPKKLHPVALDPSGTAAAGIHNPELRPGDTVEVSRAGLVYVIGDVVRPGGFPVDPSQGLTVVQALSLAWGPSQTAATTKALLIREQKGGRTVVSLNLKRMLRGKAPDMAIRDGDILFVPDSTAKNVWHRTVESAIQSTIGVTIYSGLVYSQRY